MRITAGNFFLIMVLFYSATVPADEVLWKSGMNLYIKIDEQDKYSDGRRIANQHPVSLDPREIRDALNSILVWNKSFFTGALKDSEEAESVFSLEQARLLGSYIVVGLQKAGPDEDITFVLSRRKKSFLFMKDTVYTAGRAFYLDDRLHVIIGDYDRLGDKFKERAHQSSGISEIKYYFKPGKRSRNSGFKKAIILSDGLETYRENDTTRRDWFVIDVSRAAAAYVASQNNNAGGVNAISDARLREEAEKSARERREMRLEMARLKKELKQQANGESVERSIEERLKQLESLKDKGYISDEEYTQKREEILGDL